jgi:uncharacterized membrane protein
LTATQKILKLVNNLKFLIFLVAKVTYEAKIPIEKILLEGKPQKLFHSSRTQFHIFFLSLIKNSTLKISHSQKFYKISILASFIIFSLNLGADLTKYFHIHVDYRLIYFLYKKLFDV